MDVAPRPLAAAVISSAPESMLLPLLDRLGREPAIQVVLLARPGAAPEPASKASPASGSQRASVRAGSPRWTEKLSPFHWMNQWGHPERVSERQTLDAFCAARGIAIVGSGAVWNRPGGHQIDIGIVYAPGPIDDALLRGPRLGSIGFWTLPGVGGAPPAGFFEILRGQNILELSVERYGRPGAPDTVLAHGSVAIEEQDVPESLAPKVEMMSRDLIVRALGVMGISGASSGIVPAHAAAAAINDLRHVSPAGPSTLPGIQTASSQEHISIGKDRRPAVSMQEASIEELPSFNRICADRRRAKQRTGARVLVRRILATLYLYCGYVQVRNALRRRAGRVPGVIVNFHRVADNHTDHWMTAGTDAFDQYVRFLRRWYRIVTIEEMRARLATGRNSDHIAAITFDDGYLECAVDAAAALERHGAGGAFYVCAGLCDTREVLEHDRARGYTSLRTVGGEEVRALIARGFEVGSHSMTHADFRNAAPEAIESEVGVSKTQIEAIGGVPVLGLAVPFGSARHCRPEVFAAARRAGYRYVLSHFDGVNFPGEEGFHLRRVRPPLEGLLILHAAVEGWRGLSGLFSTPPEKIPIDTGSI